jgi:hypothetical protein
MEKEFGTVSKDLQMIKNKDTSLFSFLDWITKKSNVEIRDYNPPYFLVNRWLSMANNSYCHIINMTTNKWSKNVKEFNYSNFYRTILPKHNKKINYIKKSTIDIDSDNELYTMSNKLECSKREIDFFTKTLEELNMFNN